MAVRKINESYDFKVGDTVSIDGRIYLTPSFNYSQSGITNGDFEIVDVSYDDKIKSTIL